MILKHVSMADLLDAAMVSTKTGGTFQSGVRQFIDEQLEECGRKFEVADSLAAVVSDYRGNIESWVREEESLVVERRKVVNNTCNDVARICRKNLGYTIKCVNRKEHLYEAQIVEEKVEEPEEVVEEDVVDGEIPMDDPAPVYELTGNLETDLKTLIHMHGWESVGNMTAKLIKEME